MTGKNKTFNENAMRGDDRIKSFAKMISTEYDVSYISVMDLLERQYRDTMISISKEYDDTITYESRIEMIDRSIVTTIATCKKWLASDILKEVKAMDLVYYTKQYLFFNLLRKNGGNK